MPLFDAAEAAACALSLEDDGLESDFEAEDPPAPVQPPASGLGQEKPLYARSRDAWPAGKNARSNLKKRAARNEQRSRTQAASDSRLKASALKHRAAAQPLPNPCASFADLSPSQPAWTAKREVEEDKNEYSLGTLVSEYGMEVVNWTGE